MKKVLRFRLAVFAVFLLCIATAIAAPAQTFTKLATFNGVNGDLPAASLVQGVDGNLYGTTYGGGVAGGYGTVFEITPGGSLTTLDSLDLTDGSLPVSPLVQGNDGNLYGTTYQGGAGFYGTVLKITSSGVLTTTYSFCAQTNCTDGDGPEAGLFQGSDGNFYGTTYFGGTNKSGTVFKVTSGGTLTTLYNFCSQTNCTDGTGPLAGLVQGTDGNFYGTTAGGGVNCASEGGCGTVFKITSDGTLTTVYSFCARTNCTDGVEPIAGLVQARDGNFYGTTEYGGVHCASSLGCGTVFKITSAGTLTTLYSFCAQTNCADGAKPAAGLAQATDGNFYGTTYEGGANPFGGSGSGTIFKITPRRTLTTLYSFCTQNPCTDGANPLAGLVQATNGNFYGTAAYLPGSCCGTAFSLSMGLGPFVETLPTLGPVGRKVRILGTDLTGATSVTFNGTAATFTVASPTEIKTTVPTGATTGKVQVTTPSRTLTSNVVFRVRP